MNEAERDRLWANFGSAVIKLLYAFIWQEWVVTDLDIIFTQRFNTLGNLLIPVINGFANTLNDYPMYDEDLQNGRNLFPGDTGCNNYNPHSKWHQQSAAGLLDLMFVADDMRKLTYNRDLTPTGGAARVDRVAGILAVAISILVIV